jgi:hypothetical protein
VYGDEMPYRDPHTAAPALWALRDASHCDFDVSFAAVHGSTPWRKGLEALVIGLYRQQHARSPTVNFGRMPVGYRMSSGNNAGLVRSGKRYRGGRVNEQDSSHLPSIAPAGPLVGDPRDAAWCGHLWSAWVPISAVAEMLPPPALGLYRLRAANRDGLLYIGEGLIASRLVVHARKVALESHPQGRIFAAAQPLECSWVRNDTWARHQRLELENDLIAAHVTVMGEVPAAQFLG